MAHDGDAGWVDPFARAEPDGQDVDDLVAALLDDVEGAADEAIDARAGRRDLRGREFIAALPGALRAQAAALDGLLGAVEADPRWSALELRGPLAVGGGDALSALDVVLVAAADTPELPVDAAVELVGSLGALLEVIEQRVTAWRSPHRLVVAELSGGLRVRLLLVPAGSPVAGGSGAVVLSDPDGRLEGRARLPAEVSPAQAREWLVMGWFALSDVAAAIARGAFLEGVEAMSDVRLAVCRLWAVGEGVGDPAAGLAGLARSTPARIPKGLEILMPRPLPADLRTAALGATDLLHDAANHAGRRLGVVPRTALEAAVRARLGARR